MNKEQKPVLLKMIFVGPAYSGKTSMLRRIAHDQFQQEFLATIGCDFSVKSIEIDGVQVRAQLWDTAGQERFRTIISPIYFRSSHGIFITYDVTSLDSLYEVKKYIDQYIGVMGKDVPKLLVGCKSDLTDQKVVAPDIAQAIADELGLMFIETSAKSNINCTEAFELLASNSLTYYRSLNINEPVIQNLPHPPQKKSSCC